MKQFAIIGLGGFGFDLATHLYEKRHDVVAIDIEPSLVQKIKDRVALAAVADAGTPRPLGTFRRTKGCRPCRMRAGMCYWWNSTSRA